MAPSPAPARHLMVVTDNSAAADPDGPGGQESPSGALGPGDRGGTTRERRLRSLGVMAIYLALAALLFRKGLFSPTSRNIGNHFDTRYNMWALEWTPWAVANGQNPLFTDLINFPDGVNLMWNTFMPVHGLLLWPVTATAGVVTTYNLVITLNVALSAGAAYLTLGSFVASPVARFAGGALYGFSPYMMAQSLDHPSLTAAYVPPLMLLLLHEILVRQERSAVRMGVVLGLLATLQLFTAEEMLASQVLVAGIGLLVLVACHPRAVAARARHATIALATALGVFVPLTAWPLYFQFFGPQRITGGSVQPPNVFVTDLANLVVPTSVQALAPEGAVTMSMRWTGNLSESVAYLGVPLIAVLVLAVVRGWGRRDVRFATILATAVFVLSLGPRLHVHRDDLGFPLPWSAVEKVPLIGHILPSRLMLFVFLLVAVLVATLLDGLKRRPSPRAWAGRLALGLAAVATLLPDLSYPSTAMKVPDFFVDGSAEIIPANSVALVAPYQQLFPAEPMVWQAATGFRFRMPQGYFFAPDRKGKPRYGTDLTILTLAMREIQNGAPAPEMTPEARRLYFFELNAINAETVIVGPTPHQAELLQFFTWLLGPPLEVVDDVHVWPRVHRLTA